MWRGNTGTAIALFPVLGVDENGRCQSYEHVGQHGAADYDLVIAKTRPAKPNEYKPLLQELKRIGYDVVVRRRRPNWSTLSTH